jgi:hypothetical protein
MENLQWFKFSPAEWMMGRIQRLPPQVQVDFIRLCCKYWQKECELTIEDAQLEAMDSYATLVKHRIITEEDECVRVAFLDEQMKGIDLKRHQASKAGKRSAEARMRKKQDNNRSTPVEHPLNTRSIPLNENEQRREEKIKRREEQDKEKNNIDAENSSNDSHNQPQTPAEASNDFTRPTMTAKEYIEMVFGDGHTQTKEFWQRSTGRDLRWIRGKGGVFYSRQIEIEGDPKKNEREWKSHFTNFINRMRNED